MSQTQYKLNDEEFLSGIVGVVEANRFEHMCLWKRYHQELNYPWKDRLSGYGFTVGHLNDKPVHISLLTAVIKGQKLLFTFPTSKVVDHDMIDAWLKENLPEAILEDGYLNKVDADNFSNVFRD